VNWITILQVGCHRGGLPPVGHRAAEDRGAQGAAWIKGGSGWLFDELRAAVAKGAGRHGSTEI
jgi:hypothetical protein